MSADERIVSTVIDDEMKKSYLNYAMSVIVGRALPDVRDGLKPVHRRVLFAMNEMGLRHNSPFKKSARIVGETMGKYHPHGDQAVYDTIVRMAQDFSLRYPLIDGQGNFGSVDGDNAAAMRYTEARLSRFAEQLLADIDKDTVDFVDNFDASLKEPVVLPSKVPNLLVNGSSGIAVGMATNMPPHNLREVSEAIIALIDNPEISIAELMDFIKGPDFPTGGQITGLSGVRKAYLTGKGLVKVRAVIDEEEVANHKRLIIKEIPYMVNKSALLEQIADAVREKKIEGVSDLRDESDRRGMRVVIELKKDANPELIINQLYKYTRCQETFGIINLALVDGAPKVLNLKELLQAFVDHRVEVVTRRTSFELRKAEDRAHVLEGLVKALDHIDEIIALIKSSEDSLTAQNRLVADYSLTEVQAKAILDMKLSRLAALEQEKIRNELNDLMALISELKSILADKKKVFDIIKSETREMISLFGDDRRTRILDVPDDDSEIDYESLVKEEDVVVTISAAGYVKRTPINTYRAQHRGGKGVKAAATKEDDYLERVLVANTHDFLLVITSRGRLHWLKVYRIPEAGRYAKGTPIVNLLSLEKNEGVSAVIPVKDFDPDKFLFFITRKGVVKKTSLEAFSRPRQGGIIAALIDDGDEVVDVKLTDGHQQLLLATRKGMAIKFHESDVRPMGRSSRGVRGIRLSPDDEVVGAVIADDDSYLLTVTENGYGKRTRISDYRLINRGGKGVKNIICSPRNGLVVAVKAVNGSGDLLLITKKGVIIRTPVSDIRVIGRNTQGFRLMKPSPDDKVVSAAKVEDEEV